MSSRATYVLAGVVGLGVVVACGSSSSGPTDDGMNVQTPGGRRPTEGPGTDVDPTSTAGLFIPCDVDAVLARACRSCHGDPPSGAPISLVRWADMVAKGTGGIEVAQLIETSVHSTTRPMPPSPASALSSADLAVIDGWVAGGAQPRHATCAPAEDDGGEPPPPPPPPIEDGGGPDVNHAAADADPGSDTGSPPVDATLPPPPPPVDAAPPPPPVDAAPPPPPPPCPGGTYEMEPNDDAAHASPIASHACGNVKSPDRDEFTFTLPKTAKTMSLGFSGGLVIVVTTGAQSVMVGPGVTIPFLPGATYIIDVVSVDGNERNYTLDLTVM